MNLLAAVSLLLATISGLSSDSKLSNDSSDSNSSRNCVIIARSLASYVSVNSWIIGLIGLIGRS